MLYGIDALGLAQFDKKCLRALPRSLALGCFASTFGNVWPVLRRLRGDFPRIRVHAIWEDNHKYIPEKHDPIIMREFEKFMELASLKPQIDWQFSPFCEVDGDLTNILTELSGHGVRLVNSVFRGPLMRPALAINEIHGKHDAIRGSYNYSTDGNSCVDMDMRRLKRMHSKADTFYLWHASFNGKLNDTDSTPRPDRKAWPTPELIESVAYLRNRIGNVNLGDRDIWKSHADRHSTPPEKRAYKPVLLSKLNKPELVLRGFDGKVLARLPNSGKYQDGKQWMYRCDEYGYKLAERNENRIATIDGVGKINPAFRAGTFR